MASKSKVILAIFRWGRLWKILKIFCPSWIERTAMTMADHTLIFVFNVHWSYMIRLRIRREWKICYGGEASHRLEEMVRRRMLFEMMWMISLKDIPYLHNRRAMIGQWRRLYLHVSRPMIRHYLQPRDGMTILHRMSTKMRKMRMKLHGKID